MTRLLSSTGVVPVDDGTSSSGLHAVPAGSSQSSFHVAIIMDGNGRWAKARGMLRQMGHYYGAEAARRVIEAAPGAGISHLTLFGFSTENWQRPAGEVAYLMGLLRNYLRRDVEKLQENNVRLIVIGDRDGLPADIASLIDAAESRTRDNTGLTLSIALNYGGRAEIVSCVRELARDIVAGRLRPDEIDEACLAGRLQSAFMPDPDLLVRTSGEQRISNFLLWQIAYTEMVFVDRLWPDFGAADLLDAVAAYRHRHRRFGAL